MTKVVRTNDNRSGSPSANNKRSGSSHASSKRPATSHVSGKRPVNPRMTLAILLACSFTASFGQSMMNIALPHVADRFAVTLSVANWLIVGYTVVAATSIMLEAFLVSRLGLRRLFFVAAGAFAAGSALAVVAPNYPVLLLARLVQAVCTGLFFPTVTGVIMEISTRKNVGFYLALNSGVIAIGLAVAPVISGLVLTYVGLHEMFVVPLVLALLLLIAGSLKLQNVGAHDEASADPLSVMLGFVGLAASMFGLSEITHDFAPSAIALVAGVVLLAFFVRRQLAAKTPLLNLRPLKHIRFATGLVLVMVGMMGSYALSLLLPLYFEGALGTTAFAAGLLLLIPVIINASFSFLAGRLFDKWGIWPLVPVGFAIVIVGQVVLFVWSQDLQVALVVAATAGAYAGLGLVVTPSKTTALSQLPEDLYAHGAAINSTFTQIASAIGSALFVGVLSSDVLRATASGLSRTDAYVHAFAHTLLIAVGIAVVGLVIATMYARAMRKR